MGHTGAAAHHVYWGPSLWGGVPQMSVLWTGCCCSRAQPTAELTLGDLKLFVELQHQLLQGKGKAGKPLSTCATVSQPWAALWPGRRRLRPRRKPSRPWTAKTQWPLIPTWAVFSSSAGDPSASGSEMGL